MMAMTKNVCIFKMDTNRGSTKYEGSNVADINDDDNTVRFVQGK